MRKAVLYPTLATLLILITAGTIMFFRKEKTAEQVRKSYDKYMAQLEEVTVGNVSLEIITEGSVLRTNAKEYALFEKAEKARNYLLKHAPELLPVEKSVAEMDNEYIERLRKLNPEAAEREKARRAENRRKIKAASDAQLAAWEKEAAALEKEIKADKARFKVEAETRKQEHEQRQIEIEERQARFEKLREQLIFDDNGTPIGIKNPLSFPTAPSERSDPPTTPSENQIIPSQHPPTHTEKVENNPEQTLTPLPTPRWTETWTKDITHLNTEINEKYPDVMLRPYLTDTEYQHLFPTAEARANLNKRTTALQTEYKNRLQVILDNIPKENHSEILKSVHDVLSKQWDINFANTITRKWTKED